MVHSTLWRYGARSGAIFLLVGALTAASFLGTHTSVRAQEAPNPIALDPEVQTVVQDINSSHARHGIHPLAVHPLLVTAAQNHVADMVAHAHYSHTGTDGSSVQARVVRTGFQSSNVSENWVSVHSAQSAISWWMNSFVHRNNLLNPKWTQVGVGMQVDPRNGMRVFVAVFGVGGATGGELMVAAGAQSQPVVTAAVPPGGMNYTIIPGDTLLEIAQRHSVDWEHVAAINGFTEASLLQIGDTIRLPGAGDLAPGIGGPVSAVSLPESYIEYVVRSGDTLSGIAARYDLNWQEVAAMNGMGEFSVLNLGDVVRLPSPAEKILRSNEDSSAAVGNGDAPRTHVIAAGETVITVAARYGIGWGELLRINGLGENSVIQIGQELRLP